VEVQKFGIPPIKWWLVGIHCVNVAINKLYIYIYIYFLMMWWWLGPIISPKNPNLYILHPFFSPSYKYTWQKKTILASTLIIISRNFEIVNFFQVAKFVKESIIFVEMQHLFVYHVLEYLFHLFSLFFKLWKSTFDF
jgi:hypothetical protein